MSLYSILNLIPTASMDEIKNAYDLKLLNCSNDEDINLINKAFETLSDYNSRRKYDNVLEEDENDDVRGFNLENNCETLEMEEDNYENKMIDNIINNDNDQNDILKTINQQLSNILFRLDNIEKRLYSKDINPNFFKERKKINERFYKGKKVVDIHIDRNVNGKKSSSHKTIDYDSDGNKNIKTTIPNNNI